MINFKRGAMFGLDARIALAIFGALSVISGAALYSAIQDARVTALLTEMDNIGKGVTAFFLDTGVYPTDITASSELTATQLTTDPGTAGWQGPYLPFADGATAPRLDHPIYGEISLHSKENGTWSDATASPSAAPTCLTTSSSCNVYVCIDGITADMLSALNEKADGTEGATGNEEGRFRFDTASQRGCISALTFPSTSAVD